MFKRPDETYSEALLTFRSDHSEEVFLHGASGLERMPFDAWLKKVKDQEKGKNLPEGYVPATTFMVLDEHDVIVGFLNIRHRLNEKLRKTYGHVGYMVHRDHRQKGYGMKILEFAKSYAKETLGIRSLLVACDIKNTPSKRLIEASGGILSEECFPVDEAPYYQFRIPL